MQEVKAACTLPGLRPEGIFTHFAVSDEGAAGDAFTMRQFGCLKEMIESLARAGVAFPVRHCANSAGVFDFPLSHLDMVRAGIVHLRAGPLGGAAQPACSKACAVVEVGGLSRQDPAARGHGELRQGIHRRACACEVATVPVGYADGYPRLLSPGGAEVLIGGKRCPILGRICMDQLMADVTALDQVRVGDTVTLIGRDGEEESHRRRAGGKRGDHQLRGGLRPV